MTIDQNFLSQSFVVRPDTNAVGSGCTGSAAFAAASPILMCQTTTSTDVVPYFVHASIVGTAPAAETKVIFAADTKLRYTSGGAEVTPKSPAVGSGYLPDTTTVKWYANTTGTTLKANAAGTGVVYLNAPCLIGGTAGVGLSHHFTKEEQEVLTIQPDDTSGASFLIYACATGGVKLDITVWYRQR